MLPNFEEFNLETPLELKGTIPEDRTAFYDLARSKIKYQTREENKSWQKRHLDKDNYETTATYILGAKNQVVDTNKISRFVDKLEIVVNEGIFEEASSAKGEDHKDLIPYIVEHDVYEAWLSAKRGAGQTLPTHNKHLLARRREYYLAAKDGKAQKLFNFYMFINPLNVQEHQEVLDLAIQRVELENRKLKRNRSI